MTIRPRLSVVRGKPGRYLLVLPVIFESFDFTPKLAVPSMCRLYPVAESRRGLERARQIRLVALAVLSNTGMGRLPVAVRRLVSLIPDLSAAIQLACIGLTSDAVLHYLL